ncbi:hypothetical protein BKA93DRAFT_824995 [Sparassis latifolia]|uniref:Small ribosomal subunit protein mS38 n=1 Tax=Sparassis crispa TaxID=139825 RepID=A0A401GJ53_9APHY|nr:hypothetical protein SCP_0405150 [Sparassis crispa]GBE82135.1 hypothetical protein SCP_0405150 [Sparassis crispa]
MPHRTSFPNDVTVSGSTVSMSTLAHFLRPTFSARRAYSVFSKPGGGRYFNSAKPPKVTPSTTKGKVDSSSPSGEASVSSASKDQSSPQSNTSLTSEGTPLVEDAVSSPTPSSLNHPSINPHDLKLHQFFSLHRPLLLISQPPSSIFESSPMPFAIPCKRPQEVSSLDIFTEPPEASPEEDADAARQLSRALVMNRVTPSVSWEDALQRLGLNVREGRAEEVKMAQAEFDVWMDSTKRKRRKKMKKHKLKKRRRLNRSQIRKMAR